MIEAGGWSVAEFDPVEERASGDRSRLGFFFRYPIFLLAFGPPVFKTTVVGVDTSQAHFDLWNVFQVAWVSAVALRAMLRLASYKPILVAKEVRGILKPAFILGLLFAGSVTYSSGRIVSAEYAVLYFLTWICVAEFIVDAFRTPPDWFECLLQLRMAALVLMGMVMATLFVAPALVLYVQPGEGVRLMGGTVANMALYPEVVAIISAYTFLHSLESRVRAGLLFTVGAAGSMFTQTRGVEIALPVILLVMTVGWAKKSKRRAYFAASGLTAATLVVAAIAGMVGGGRIWETFNRGEDLATIATASGRTGVWADQIQYCLSHPQGMGYIAGVRAFHRRDFATNLHAALTNIGGTDNAYMQVLTDAGWLALALYLTLIARAMQLGLRAAGRRETGSAAVSFATRETIRCTLFLLLFASPRAWKARCTSSPCSVPSMSRTSSSRWCLAPRRTSWPDGAGAAKRGKRGSPLEGSQEMGDRGTRVNGRGWLAHEHGDRLAGQARSRQPRGSTFAWLLRFDRHCFTFS